MKIQTFALIPAALLLISATTPEAALTADFRCLIASLTMAGADEKEAAEAGKNMSLYYLGKVDARSPGFDLEAGIRKEMVRMSNEELRKLLIACAAEVEKRGQYLITTGQRLGSGDKS